MDDTGLEREPTDGMRSSVLEPGAGTSLEAAARIINRVLSDRYDRPSLVSQLACRIGAEIIDRVRLPGEDLNSVELSTTYKASRVTVREALMLLEKEGLVEIQARRRPRVVSLSMEEIDQIYHARIALIQVLVGEVCEVASPQAIETLSRQVERMKEAIAQKDEVRYLWESVEFHEMNNAIARNTIIRKLLDSLVLRTLPLRRLGFTEPGAMERSCKDHADLVQAYRNRDPILACAILRSNHLKALARIKSVLKQRVETAPS